MDRALVAPRRSRQTCVTGDDTSQSRNISTSCVIVPNVRSVLRALAALVDQRARHHRFLMPIQPRTSLGHAFRVLGLTPPQMDQPQLDRSMRLINPGPSQVG